MPYSKILFCLITLIKSLFLFEHVNGFAPSQTFGVDCRRIESSTFASQNQVVENSDISLCTTRQDDNDKSIEIKLKDLYKHLDAAPVGLLSLSTSEEDGERGIFLNHAVTKDDVLLKIPLSSCIRDDKPPIWYDTYKTLHRNDVDSDNIHYNPSKWATRLAATLLDIQIRSDSEEEEDSSSSKIMIGLKKWLSMMPNKDYLHDSLPIHWSEEIVSFASCTALEISVDASYFARAEAISDLVSATNVDGVEEDAFWGDIDLTKYDIEEMASNIFDLVQTRSCRAERTDGIQIRPSLRILAPIFDYINHGSCYYEGVGSANAYFGLEGDDEKDSFLVVRARRDLEANTEVLIDYGDSARPAWRCLHSYGFVPKYHKEEEGDDANVAEVYMDGARYEVTPHTVPYEMVEAAAASYFEEQKDKSAFDSSSDDNDNETLLTPEVALRISKRMSNAASQLMTEPQRDEDLEEGSMNCSDDIAIGLASSLRWSQHQVLLECAKGLQDYAARNEK